MMAITEPDSEHRPTVAQTLEKTAHDALELARAEIALTKRQAIEQARSMARSAIFLVAGVMFVQAALTSFGVLLVLVLRGPAPGLALVAGLLAVAALLATIGIRVLKANHVQSASRLERDVREIIEAVK